MQWYFRGGGVLEASSFYSKDVICKRDAFTLGEVLITLGIIGVIAAITIPALIAKYQKKVLETQFKTAYSVLANANMAMAQDYPSMYNDLQDSSIPGKDRYSNHLDRLIKYISNSRMCNIYYLKCAGGNPKAYDSFVKGSYAHIDADSLTTKSIITSSGILIFMGPWAGSGYHIDINGPAKGPNRLGYDLFSFSIDKNNNLVPYTAFGGCLTSQREHYQGFTCSKYAVANKCETDSSKTYWECLP